MNTVEYVYVLYISAHDASKTLDFQVIGCHSAIRLTRQEDGLSYKYNIKKISLFV